MLKVGITGQNGFIGTHLFNTLGLFKDEFERIAINLECSSSPCYSPNGKIVVTVHFGASKEFRAVTASAQEYISPWS